MKTWILSVLVVLAGCGGKVAVDTSGEPVHACTATCREALEQGGEPCASATTAASRYSDLAACACDPSACADACGAELCAGEAVSLDMDAGQPACLKCIYQHCAGGSGDQPDLWDRCLAN